MPEGHTIHRLAQDHQKWFAGQKLIVESPQGRFAEEAKHISGKPLVSVSAKGKHLFYRWSRDRIVHVHLGLYGKFRIHQNPPPEPRGAVRIRAIGESQAFDLNGPNQSRLINLKQQSEIESRLGPDPLRADADPEAVWTRVRKSRSAIGALLLNQSVISGIGNVYRAEILHLLGIHPGRAGNAIARSEFDQLWDTSVKLLRTGVKYNRIITVSRTEVDKPLSRLRSNERLTVYKKRKCTSCANPIQSWTLAARTIYACVTCQK